MEIAARFNIIYTIVLEQLASSDYIIRNRALQFICDNKALFFPVKGIIETILVNYLENEKHPKVVRWLAYTLAIIEGSVRSINAIQNKLKVVTEEHVIEWLVASLESLYLHISGRKTFPAELYSEYDFHIGIVKSWAYKFTDENTMQLLLKGLNHQEAKIRKWAALSIGSKRITTAHTKAVLKASFADDDYVVREWSMYALKDLADESDFHAYAISLEKELHPRVREWAVKSLPYTQSRDVPELLISEFKGPYYKSDLLYAEAVLSSLSQYSDQIHIKDTIISALYETQDDIVLLAAIRGIERQKVHWDDKEYSQCLITAYEKAHNISVKRQIGLHLLNIYSFSEMEAIREILSNEIKANILRAIVISNVDPIISKLLATIVDPTSNEERLANISVKNESIFFNKEPPPLLSEIQKGWAIFDEIVNDVAKGQRISAKKTQIIIGKEIVMGDQYRTGQAGAVGPHSNAHDMNFNQVWLEALNNESLKILSEDLSKLRQAMRGQSSEADHDIAISEIAKAEKAALTGDKNRVVNHLKAAGKWALDVATNIGSTVAAEAIKKSMGL